MHWNDASIILSTRKYGESSAVVRLLAREHGVFAGVVRGANSKNNRGIIQPGNVVSSQWQARLSQQLGSFRLESMEAHAAHIMNDAGKLAALTAACTITELALPERHPYPKIFAALHELLHTLTTTGDWQKDYIKYELALLAESGFGLDLSECAATGQTHDLTYVSPKSGRAVSKEAGLPYHDKMLPLPSFLRPLPTPPLQAGEGTKGNSLLRYAKELRANQTEAEQIIWKHLRAHRFENYGFRRQYPIEDKYIADFVCLEKMLVIELDGGHHTEQQEYDKARSEFLEKKGFNVIRFWNNDIMSNLEGVLTLISEQLKKSPLHEVGRAREGQEVLAGMQLTGYFLEHSLLEPHGKSLPAARTRLYHLIKESNAA